MKTSIKTQITAASCLLVSVKILSPIPTFANSSVTIVQPRQSYPVQTNQSSSVNRSSVTLTSSNTSSPYCVQYNVPVRSSVKQCLHPSSGR